MTTRTFVASLLVAGALGWLAAKGFTDEGDDAGKAAEKMMKEWMEKMGQVGEQHAYLKPFEGTWSLKFKGYEMDGSVKESTGTATYKLVLGGRFLRQEVQGSYDGKPFEGLAYMGFDNNKQQYVSIWMDSMSTSILSATGQCEGGKSWTMTGVWPTPMGDMQMTDHTRFTSDTEVVTEMKGKMGDQEFPMMEITYTKK
jgi:hypothetical protein